MTFSSAETSTIPRHMANSVSATITSTSIMPSTISSGSRPCSLASYAFKHSMVEGSVETLNVKSCNLCKKL